MKRYAIVETGESPRIERLLDEMDDRFEIMQIVEVHDALSDDQIHGAPIVALKAGNVVIRHPAVRALSGLVAVLSDDNKVEAIRDLGPEPVEVAANVRRFVEQNAEFDPETQHRTGPVDRIGKAKVERIWTVRKLTAEELDGRRREKAIAQVRAQFGQQGLHVAFEQENRLRLIEGRDRLASVDEFIEEHLAGAF